MQKRNLTKEKIIQTTFLLADEIGMHQVTFTKIAEKLGIKYPSLYNHFSNIDDLKVKMTRYLLQKLNAKLMQQLVGKSGEHAIREYANVYREFAFKNKTAYGLIMNIPSTEDEEVKRLAKEMTDILHLVLDFYIKDETLLIHKNRALRSLLHGFISLQFLGYFRHRVDAEESFQLMLDDYIFSVSGNNRN